MFDRETTIALLTSLSWQADVLVAISMIVGATLFVIRKWINERTKEARKQKEIEESHKELMIMYALKRINIGKESVEKLRESRRKLEGMDEPVDAESASKFIENNESVKQKIREVAVDMAALFPHDSLSIDIINELKIKEKEMTGHGYLDHAILKALCVKYEKMIYVAMNDLSTDIVNPNTNKEDRKKEVETNIDKVLGSYVASLEEYINNLKTKIKEKG